MRLKGKVAMITGGALVIVKDIALTFAKEGADIAIIDLNAEGLAQTAQEIRGLGREVLEARVDISKTEEISRFVDQIMGRFGKLDVLVNNAAFIIYNKFLKFEENDWQRVLNVTLTGTFLCGQAAAREMVKNGKGRIINIASLAGEFGIDRGCAYAAAKGGVIALTRVMALELAPYGINVNAINPGPVDTENLRAILTDKEIEARASKIPLGRFARPGDIAKAALFLATEDSDYFTGQMLRID
ncbi:MAG: glucose 1-dehydrogenase, partial [Thermodesulfobacteriota bacterium]